MQSDKSSEWVKGAKVENNNSNPDLGELNRKSPE